MCTKLPEAEAPKLANPGNPNYAQLAGFGDLDAMVELHGHARAENPGMNVYYKGTPDVKADDLSGHVVIIGGIAWGGGATLAGYFLGNVAFVHENLEKIILAILFVSMMPAMIAAWRGYRGRRNSATEAVQAADEPERLVLPE